MKRGRVLRRTRSFASARLSLALSSFVDVFVATMLSISPVIRGRAVTRSVTTLPFGTDPIRQTIGRARRHEPWLLRTSSGSLPVSFTSTTVTSSAVSGPRLVTVTV